MNRNAGVAAAAILAAASPSAAKVDAVKLGQIRSLIAEAVAVEQAAAQGRVTATYADSLRGDFRRKLATFAHEPELASVANRAQVLWSRQDLAGLAALRDRLVGEESRQGRHA